TGMLDGGTADGTTTDAGNSPDADTAMPDGGEVLCGAGVAEIENDLADNDCDGTVDELEVCTGASAPYQTIGAAMTAASSGDTIEVCAGTFTENLTVTAKDLRIRGAGVGQTILDAQQLGRALSVS